MLGLSLVTLLNEMLPQARSHCRHWSPSCFDTFLTDKTGLSLLSQLLVEDLLTDTQTGTSSCSPSVLHSSVSLCGVDCPPDNVLFLLSPSQRLTSRIGASAIPLGGHSDALSAAPLWCSMGASFRGRRRIMYFLSPAPPPPPRPEGDHFPFCFPQGP